MIDAMARAGAVLDEPRYRAAAATAADFLLTHLRDQRGRLLHCWRAGQARHEAFLDDHASLCNALLTLYETQSDRRRLDEASGLADAMLTGFADADAGGFFYTSSHHEPLIARKKDLWDTPVPSSTGLAAAAFLRLARHTGRDDYRRAAEETLRVSTTGCSGPRWASGSCCWCSMPGLRSGRRRWHNWGEPAAKPNAIARLHRNLPHSIIKASRLPRRQNRVCSS